MDITGSENLVEVILRKGSIAPRGDKAANWKGGKVKSDRYIRIYMPEHPFCRKDKYVYEHRLVMENFLGRYLDPQEEIHHLDGDKHNNAISNLMLFPDRSAHIKFHWTLPNYKGRWTSVKNPNHRG